MKVAILAGGLGTRLSEETTVKPKPMVEIGGRPMLWHIMKIYAAYGFKEFVIALGYKGEIIKDYFLNYHYHARDLTVNLENGEVSTHDGEARTGSFTCWIPGRTPRPAGGSNAWLSSSGTNPSC